MMSLCSPKDSVVICSENISNDYKVTTAEILSHAKKLGVDFSTERHLLPIVLQGLLHPLPANWIPCYDRESGEFFYYNLEDNTSQWEHPIDEQYKHLISKLKNEYNGSVNEFLSEEDSLNMLPLRQNRKPQLLPIKQLLKFKDEEKTAVEDKILKPDLHSSLKMKNDSSPTYKKSVSFITSEPVADKDIQFRSSEFEKSLDKTKFNTKVWNSEDDDLWKKHDDFRSVHEHGQYSSDDDNKLEATPFSKNLNKKITSMKQPFNQTKSNSEVQPSNTFKRLHINLRHPDSLLFSDSNHDDTIKNILSASPSSELVSEEEESPHNVLTNVTESGIDVNTVTDLQKLKARNKLTNQNNENNDVNKQVLRVIDMSLRSAVAQLEQNLNSKIEAKTTAEIMKLKKHSSLNIEKENKFETANEAQERFKVFKEEIDKEMKENHTVLSELQNKYDVEMNELKENLNKCIKFAEVKHDCVTNSENFQKQFQSLIDERLNNIEQNLVKKVENLETSIKAKLEDFETEKEKKLSEYHEKFLFLIDENQKNIEKRWQESSEKIIQRSLNELFAKEVKSDDPVFHSLEKIVVDVLNEKQSQRKCDNFGKKTTATQTENTFNVDEIITLKKNVNQISTTVKNLVEGTSFPKRFESKETFRKGSGGILLRSIGKMDDPIRVQTPLKVNSLKTDFSPFEEFSSRIDEELDRYRRNYLSNSKWLNIEVNKDL